MSSDPGYRSIRTVFLDRDGVLNRKAPEGAYVYDWSHAEVLPGVPEALRLLREAGLPVYVVSNQRGVALGLYSVAQVEELHRQLGEAIAAAGGRVEAFFFCPHDKNVCDCRKPASGLFEKARAQDGSITWNTSLMVGDSLSDIEAGERLGMQTIFIDGEPERQKEGAQRARQTAGAVCGSLLEAVQLVLGSRAEASAAG